MRLAKPHPVRNKFDFAEPGQIRSLKKRLGISADDLQRAVGKVGNSIAAVSKELKKGTPVTEAASVQIESSSRSEGGVPVASA